MKPGPCGASQDSRSPSYRTGDPREVDMSLHVLAHEMGTIMPTWQESRVVLNRLPAALLGSCCTAALPCVCQEGSRRSTGHWRAANRRVFSQMRGFCRGRWGRPAASAAPTGQLSPRFPPAQPPLGSYKPCLLQLRGQRWPCSSNTTPRVTLPNLILTYSKVLPKTNDQGDRANAGWRFCAKEEESATHSKQSCFITR